MTHSRVRLDLTTPRDLTPEELLLFITTKFHDRERLAGLEFERPFAALMWIADFDDKWVCVRVLDREDREVGIRTFSAVVDVMGVERVLMFRRVPMDVTMRDRARRACRRIATDLRVTFGIIWHYTEYLPHPKIPAIQGPTPKYELEHVYKYMRQQSYLEKARARSQGS